MGLLALASDATDDAMIAALEQTKLFGTLRRATENKADVLSLRVGSLSAGQRQRVALARILLQDADIILLDEPDANLDAAGLELVAHLIGRLVKDGKMVAVAAHGAELTNLDGATFVRLQS